MATTTTNFGWDIPQSTDLVKDGATAIAALGQDIDTAFVDFKGGTTGQVLKKTSGTDLDVEWGTASSGLTLINTTSFSAVSSISVSDVFSATYNNYRVDIVLTGASANASDSLRLRVAGADNSTSNYNYAGIFLRTTAASIPYGNTNQTSFADILPHSTNGNEAFTLNIYSPFVAERTKYNAGGIGQDVTSIATHFQAGVFAATTSFTGFTFISGSGTFTGTIKVYGLAN
jgi:hypothetical protein